MKELILKLKKEGKTVKEIMSILNCSKGTIYYHTNAGIRIKALLRANKKDICTCGNAKKIKATVCKKCDYKNRKNKLSYSIKREQINNSTLESYFKNYTTNTRHSAIRRLARVFIEETGIKKECKICGFNDYVEVCHIKAIKDFDKSALIKEVNHLDNLVYLCPNHHKLLDLKKLKF